MTVPPAVHSILVLWTAGSRQAGPTASSTTAPARTTPTSTDRPVDGDDLGHLADLATCEPLSAQTVLRRAFESGLGQ